MICCHGSGHQTNNVCITNERLAEFWDNAKRQNIIKDKDDAGYFYALDTFKSCDVEVILGNDRPPACTPLVQLCFGLYFLLLLVSTLVLFLLRVGDNLPDNPCRSVISALMLAQLGLLSAMLSDMVYLFINMSRLIRRGRYVYWAITERATVWTIAVLSIEFFLYVVSFYLLFSINFGLIKLSDEETCSTVCGAVAALSDLYIVVGHNLIVKKWISSSKRIIEVAPDRKYHN